MRILDTLTPIDAPRGSAVALGFFDGVHLGHRRVLGAAVDCAGKNGLTAAAFTFRLPDSSNLKGGRILSPAQKHARIEALGIHEYMEPPFERFCALSTEAFVKDVLLDCFHAAELFCGDNFTFGAHAAGNVETLIELCRPYGIRVNVVDMALYGIQPVSSTRIRAALEEARLVDVNAMLGQPYAIDWPVTHGKGLGASRLGTPTINQNYPAGMLQPCPGVYVTRIWLQGRWWPAATGIGRRPTVDSENAPVTCETYVPGFAGDVYGQNPVLEFHRYLCPVRKFDSLEELAALIHRAADESTAYFAAQTRESSE
ncbi:MAG: bifunctional riboflavin kinase/FMN adenylyltransferase [Gemmiger sp.]